MDTPEAIAHLYRRFGLGASVAEVSAATPLGVEGAIAKLIDSPPPYKYPIDPYEFVWYAHVDPDLASEYFRRWWLLSMLCTTDPLTERMAAFWHSHFAVSAEKVMFGPMMLDYVQALRSNGLGKFRDLLETMVKSPALMEYLDMSRSLKGRPNENLPRELMELYTLGVGNYSESDVRSVARAFTGWGYVNTFFELPGNNRERTQDALREGRVFAAFSESPAFHDQSEKQFLGRSGKLNGEEVLDILALHANTAEFLVGKLWSYFLYPNPTKEELEPIVAVFIASGGDIRRTLGSMARSSAFYSEKCVRQKIKSPLDYTVGMMRSVGLGPMLLAMRKEPGSFDTPLPALLQQILYDLLVNMDRQGMGLLRPPNPSGWAEGQAWATSAAMGARMLLTIPFTAPDDTGVVLKRIIKAVAQPKPKDGVAVLARLCRLFDWSPSESTRKILTGIWAGNPDVYLVNAWEFAPRFTKTLHLVAAAPEAHMC